MWGEGSTGGRGTRGDAASDFAARSQAAWWRLRYRFFTIAGIAVMLAWLAALVSAVPSRSVVDTEDHAVAAFKADRLPEATKDFEAVIARVSRSASARFGLACAFWKEGRLSAAGIETVIAMEDGLLFPQPCGQLGSFASRFLRVPTGVSGVLLVPRVASDDPVVAHAWSAVRSPADPIGADRSLEARRLMAAACISWRASLFGLAAQYADFAVASYAAGTDDLHRFLRCIGPTHVSDIRCAGVARHLGQCQFRAPIAQAIASDYSLGHI